MKDITDEFHRRRTQRVVLASLADAPSYFCGMEYLGKGESCGEDAAFERCPFRTRDVTLPFKKVGFIDGT
jgi:hypothetical protein